MEISIARSVFRFIYLTGLWIGPYLTIYNIEVGLYPGEESPLVKEAAVAETFSH